MYVFGHEFGWLVLLFGLVTLALVWFGIMTGSRKKLVALGTAITFAYVGAYVSAYLAQGSAEDHRLEVFWWIGGVCWFLALVLPARLGHLLAKRQGWYGVIGTLLAVIPWLVLSGLATLYVVMLAASLE